jgi:hypothetical protein
MKKFAVLSLISVGFLATNVSHAAGIYSDARINAAINCMAGKVQPADYQKFVDAVFSPSGTARLGGDKPVCVSYYTAEYRNKAFKVSEAYGEQLFASCDAAGMRELIAYRYDIEQKLAYKIAQRDQSFARMAADALDAKRACN